LSPLAELQYNIGVCHEALGRKDEAIKAYLIYLQGTPKARDREKVEQKIDELRRKQKDR